MNNSPEVVFSLFGLVTVLLFVTGLYCVVVTKNLIRVLIGLELLTKSVTLLLVLAGHMSGRVALAQTLIVTLIVIEVVVMVVAAGVIVGVFRRRNSLDTSSLRSMKG
jgi:NADH-quinone oxidoreductase subunit K